MTAHSAPPLWKPIVLTDRQEQFCQQILIGKPATIAAQIAYGHSYGVAAVTGSRLLKSVKVTARIEQLRAHEAAAAKISVPFLTRELIATAQEARALAQQSAATAAYGLIAKLHGLIVDKVAIDAVVRKPSSEPASPDEMTESDWLRKHGLTIEGEVSPATISHTDTTDNMLTEPSTTEEDIPQV